MCNAFKHFEIVNIENYSALTIFILIWFLMLTAAADDLPDAIYM